LIVGRKFALAWCLMTLDVKTIRYRRRNHSHFSYVFPLMNVSIQLLKFFKIDEYIRDEQALLMKKHELKKYAFKACVYKAI
jgi:hypothetical protein